MLKDMEMVGGITGNNMENAQIKYCANTNEIYGSMKMLQVLGKCRKYWY